MYSIGLVLQAQLVFIFRDRRKCMCGWKAELCLPAADGNSKEGVYMLVRSSGSGFTEMAEDTTELLTTKYKMTREEVLLGPVRCFDNNGKQQLANPFEEDLPLDPKADCVFNLKVCGAEEP